MSDFRDTIKRINAWRSEHPDATGVKINLYKPVEVEAVALAVRQHPELADACRVECVMQSDSFHNTHLARASTVVKEGEHELLFDFVRSMTKDTAIELRRRFPDPLTRPFLMGDMPDGPARAVDTCLAAAEELMASGSDCIKLEVTSPAVFDAIEALSSKGIPVIGHIGYTPQAGQDSNRRHGATLDDAHDFFAKARAIRERGGCGMVMERVALEVADALSANAADDFYTCCIFTGRPRRCGQSLNIFDSIIKPDFKGVKFFPPTARYTREQFIDVYTPEIIAVHLAELMALTARGEFPVAPKSPLSESDAEAIAAINPWKEPALA